MKKTRSFKFGLIALVGILLASFQVQRFASKTVQPLTTKGAKPAVAGRDYTTMYTMVSPGNGKSAASVVIRALRPDGSAVISYNPPGVHGDQPGQGQVGIQNGKSRTWFPIQTGSKPRQIFEAVAHGKSVVWGETESTTMSLDWRLFSVTTGQQVPKLLGNSFDLVKSNDVSLPPGFRMLATDGANVWWVMAIPTSKSPTGGGEKIVVRDIGARKPMKIAVDHGMLPVSISRGLVYVRSKDVDPSMTSSRYEIRLLKNGVDTLITGGSLAKDEHILSSCASDTLLAWTMDSVNSQPLNPNYVVPHGHLHVIKLATKVQQVVTLSDSAGGMSLGCGTNFVAWGNGSGYADGGQYVMNVPSGKIWKLGSNPGISEVLVAGNYLAWTLPIPSGGIAPTRVVKWHGV